VEGGLSDPAGLAVDKKGDLFIADTGNNQVVEVPSGGGAQTTVGSGLDAPKSVAVDKHGDVFIADTGNNQVVEVPSGGGAQTTVGSGLDAPQGVAVDKKGDVFIADTGNNQVVEVPAGGGAQTTVGSGFKNPEGVAVDENGDVFVADTGNNQLVEVPGDGGPQTTVVSSGDNVTPAAVSVDAEGDLFFTDIKNKQVDEIPVFTDNVANLTDDAGFLPGGVAADAEGNVFISNPSGPGGGDVVDASTGALPAMPPGLTLSSEGVLSGTPTTPGTYSFVVEDENGVGASFSPLVTITVTPPPVVLGEIAVATADQTAVLELAPGGGSETTPGWGLKQPYATAFDAKGDLFIADSLHYRVLEVPRGDGASAEATVKGAMGVPTAMTFDAEGDLFVANIGPGNKVVEVPANGGPDITYGSGLQAPEGVAVDAEGDVFIADAIASNRVVEDPANGGPQTTIASGLNFPTELAVDPKGDLFIVERGGVMERPAGGGSLTTVGTGLTDPGGVALDAEGDLLITNDGNLVELPANGGPQTTLISGLGGGYLSVYVIPPKLTADSPPVNATVGTPYSYTFKATSPKGEPKTTFFLSAVGLPPGLTLHKKTGVLSGTPTTPGNYAIQVEAANGAYGVVSPILSIVVSPSQGATRRRR
ncbi:MAG: putative Ig domain-containing protein, partial [Acidimicrobiales bacterium]